MMDSADRLKYIRKKLKLTQEKLAISMDLKRDNITSLESRKVKISTLHAIAMEHLYGVNKEWLLYGKGDEFISERPTTIENSNVTRIIVEHQGLVKQFKDPTKGLLNNKRMIDLEEVSPKLYEKFTEELQKAHEVAMIMKGEREKSKTEKKTPSIKNRASGD